MGKLADLLAKISGRELSDEEKVVAEELEPKQTEKPPTNPPPANPPKDPPKDPPKEPTTVVDKTKKPSVDKGGAPVSTSTSTITVDNIENMSHDEINDNWDAIKAAIKQGE